MTQQPGRAQPAWTPLPLPSTPQGPSADKNQASHQKLLYFPSKLLASLPRLISCQDQLFSPLHHYHRAYIISWQITRTDEWLFGLQLSGEYKMLPAVQSPGTASGQRLSWGVPALLGLWATIVGGHRAGCCQHRAVGFWWDLYPFLKKNPALHIAGHPSCIPLPFTACRAAAALGQCPRQCPGVHNKDSLHLVPFSPCSCHSTWPS